MDDRDKMFVGVFLLLCGLGEGFERVLGVLEVERRERWESVGHGDGGFGARRSV